MPMCRPLVPIALTLASIAAAAHAQTAPRPPAVPLVAHDPYFSVWSFNDRLTDGWTRHWTGAIHAMCGMVRIDGAAYRFAGQQPASAKPMEQVRCDVQPTRTVYEFRAGGVALTLTFLNPLLPNNLEVLSRPVTYVTFAVASIDETAHDVAIYFDATGEWCVDRADQPVIAGRLHNGELEVLRIGTQEQAVLQKRGDDLRIDWGHFCIAAPREALSASVIGGHNAVRGAFVADGRLPEADESRFPRPANDDWPVLAVALDVGKVGAEALERTILLAYDDQFCIEYFHRKLRGYWAREGQPFETMLRAAWQEKSRIAEACRSFDADLMADLTAAGGDGYATMAALAYRQCMAAHKLAADFDGTPLMFSKENFSNGCIATVDVIYPASPLFVALSPRLLVAQLVPVLEYARTPRWPHPFAPHDLGTYPHANGQVYGGGERSTENQMPVEESANMILMLAALAQADGKAELARKYAAQVKRWADYLDDRGIDPANQLCTDDFAGHLARNANLSLKAIVGLGAYAKIAKIAKREEEYKTYRAIAEAGVQEWLKLAADGDHTRLAFDKPGTWSQKYNLVWDRVLDLQLFAPEVAAAELAYYRARQNSFGLPLDHRADYTKLDWCVWSACLTGKRDDFDALVSPLVKWMNETPTRVPLTDWFDTKTGRQVGFQARSVVGGVFAPLACDSAIREKWAKRR